MLSRMPFVVSGPALAVSLAFALPALAANDPDSVQVLRKKVSALEAANRSYAARLADLEKRLAALVPAPAMAAGPASGRSMQPGPVVAQATAPVTTSAAAPAAQTTASLPVTSSVPKSVEAIYQEASGFTQGSGRWSVEPSLTYGFYDVRDLRLNGFLALDSIFLGNINLDRIKSETLTLDTAVRYKPSADWQFDFNVPVVMRKSRYFSGGAGYSTNKISEASLTENGEIGDVGFGLSYRLFAETADRPDTFVSLRVKAPTGSSPYGIKVRNVDDGNTNLGVPDSLPTGNGVWSVSGGVSVVKTLDPAVVFANLSYTHYLSGHFNDISASVGQTLPGDVKLGDTWGFGLGFAFALNERLSLGMSYSQQMGNSTSLRPDGSSWQKVPGSESNSATLNIGMTYSLGQHLSIVPNVAIGLTPDSPNYNFSVRFPYNF
ncbi:hypothetical protein LHK_00159 [Laribacter hongkongensis HLHK9]|uniref:Transporter n=1 Tax=Laribacter hongkongensis (strain HLHK9) TaxID=557598 RepID=C1DA42_LARHH|nr:hypothetical protein [Laribacter hongkongensis]ACO73155.1 hypothetical protein LHK_00159 [Laribacter hongkongensis HLHK9]